TTDLDNAINENVIRHIGTRIPLLGPFSRDGWSHPGPIFFYVMWIPYRVLGSDSWAMVGGALLVNAVAIGGAVVIALRWGGRVLGITTAVGMLWLVIRLPQGFVLEPWN